MRAPELFTGHTPDLPLRSYLYTPRGMPPLDAAQLQMHMRINAQCRSTTELIEGAIALILSYKGYSGAVTSLDELENGEVWQVLQIQGCRTRKAVRLNAGMSVGPCFADHINWFAKHPESEVRQLRMPAWHSISNIDGAHDPERAQQKYQSYAAALELSFSHELKCYVRDIRTRTSQLLTAEGNNG